MKKIFSLTILFLFFCCTLHAQNTNFKGKQKEQEKAIKGAYKAKKITENEYNKLMDEQEVIKSTIEKYELDDYLDSHEKNTIYDKQARAADRLRRYKTNGERF
jgi:predicted transcriptional regulator